MAKPSLSPKHARFVAEYLKDLNATQAAKRAGYSEKTAKQQGTRLLSYAAIQESISQGNRRILSAHGVTAERIISRLEKIAFGDIRKIVEWGPNSVKLKESSELSEAEAAMVAEISQIRGSTKLKRVDPMQALNLLGRYKGLWSEGDSEAPDDDEDDDVVVYLPSNGR